MAIKAAREFGPSNILESKFNENHSVVCDLKKNEGERRVFVRLCACARSTSFNVFCFVCSLQLFTCLVLGSLVVSFSVAARATELGVSYRMLM